MGLGERDLIQKEECNPRIVQAEKKHLSWSASREQLSDEAVFRLRVVKHTRERRGPLRTLPYVKFHGEPLKGVKGEGARGRDHQSENRHSSFAGEFNEKQLTNEGTRAVGGGNSSFG